MALINCPVCGKKISNKANMCPHCGYSKNQPAQVKENLNCPNCGAQIIEGAKFCRKCGTRVRNDEPKNTKQDTLPADSSVEKLSIGKKVGLVIACFFAIVGLKISFKEDVLLLRIVSSLFLVIIFNAFKYRTVSKYTWVYVICFPLVIYCIRDYYKPENETQATSSQQDKQEVNKSMDYVSEQKSDIESTTESFKIDEEMAAEGYKMGLLLATADASGDGRLSQLLDAVDNIDDANLSAEIKKTLDLMAEQMFEQYYSGSDKHKSISDVNRLKAIYKKNVIKGLKDGMKAGDLIDYVTNK